VEDKGKVVNYTQSLSRLIEDIGRNVADLSFIDMDKLLVLGFSREGDKPCHPYRTRLYYSVDSKRLEKVREIYLGERRIHYILFFNLPDYAYLPFTQKFRLLFDLLLELDPEFTGHLRYNRPDGMEEEFRTLELWCRYLMDYGRREVIEFLVTEWEELAYDELKGKLPLFEEKELNRIELAPEDIAIRRMRLDPGRYEQRMINRFIREAADYRTVFEFIFRKFYPKRE